MQNLHSALVKLCISVEEQELLNKYDSNPQKRLEALNKLMSEQKEELKKFDMSLVVQLDQKVIPYQLLQENKIFTCRSLINSRL